MKKIIVISDIHLGIDDQVSELVKNRPILTAFIEKIRKEKEIDELVIAGDFLDQWFYPGDFEMPVDSGEFYYAVAKNNRTVLNAIRGMISDGIKVVYVPGNHDMTLTEDVLEKILPGIIQVRDAKGLGRYRTGVRHEIMIEHGHRYEFFCAPDTITNREAMTYGDPILPPGYFYSRVGVTSLLEGNPEVHKKLPIIEEPSKADEDQYAAYLYYKAWTKFINEDFHVTEAFDEKFIKVGIDGFRGTFAISDLVPTVDQAGRINARLYKDIQAHWQEVQKTNHVAVLTTALEQLENIMDVAPKNAMAKRQYFDLDPEIETVVFGHTHVPAFKQYTYPDGRKKTFANSGTWIDHNFVDLDNTTTFVFIESDRDGDTVKLLKCTGDGSVETPVKVHNAYTEY